MYAYISKCTENGTVTETAWLSYEYGRVADVIYGALNFVEDGNYKFETKRSRGLPDSVPDEVIFVTKVGKTKTINPAIHIKWLENQVASLEQVLMNRHYARLITIQETGNTTKITKAQKAYRRVKKSIAGNIVIIQRKINEEKWAA